MGILHALGLAKAPEPAIDWEAKFKAAVVDLEAETELTKGLRAQLDAAEQVITGLKSDTLSELSIVKTEKAELLKESEENANMIAELGAEVDALKAGFNQRLADAVQEYQVDAQKWRDRAAREHARRTKTRTPAPKAKAPAKKGAH